VARFSRLFLGPRDNFPEKFMTKTDLPYNTAGDSRLAGDPSPAIDDFKAYMGDV
jgi:hypothetical protein